MKAKLIVLFAVMLFVPLLMPAVGTNTSTSNTIVLEENAELSALPPGDSTYVYDSETVYSFVYIPGFTKIIIYKITVSVAGWLNPQGGYYYRTDHSTYINTDSGFTFENLRVRYVHHRITNAIIIGGVGTLFSNYETYTGTTVGVACVYLDVDIYFLGVFNKHIQLTAEI